MSIRGFLSGFGVPYGRTHTAMMLVVCVWPQVCLSDVAIGVFPESSNASDATGAAARLNAAAEEAFRDQAFAEHEINYFGQDDLLQAPRKIAQERNLDIIVELSFVIDERGSLVRVEAREADQSSPQYARSLVLGGQSVSEDFAQLRDWLRWIVLPALLAHFDSQDREGLFANCIWPDGHYPDETNAHARDVTLLYASDLRQSMLAERFTVSGVDIDSVETLCSPLYAKERMLGFHHEVRGRFWRMGDEVDVHLVWQSRKGEKRTMRINAKWEAFDPESLATDIVEQLSANAPAGE